MYGKNYLSPPANYRWIEFNRSFFKFIKRVSLSFYIIYVDIYLLNRVTYRFIECENYFSFFKQISLRNYYFNYLTYTFLYKFSRPRKNIRRLIKYCFFVQKNNFLFQRTIAILLYKTYYYYSLFVLRLVLCLSFFDVSF